jgi:hypothetical protein
VYYKFSEIGFQSASGDGKPSSVSVDPPLVGDSRIDELEKSLKRLKDDHERGSVESALKQVRTLALRQSTDNGVLIAAMENLYDTASRADHEDLEVFKIALKMCRENDKSGPLQTLVTRLVGTDQARKAQSAVDTWRKAKKKEEKEKKDIEKEKDKDKEKKFDQAMQGGYGYGSYQNNRRGFRGRRNFRFGSRVNSNYRNCFLCNSPDHFARFCPQNLSNTSMVPKVE